MSAGDPPGTASTVSTAAGAPTSNHAAVSSVRCTACAAAVDRTTVAVATVTASTGSVAAAGRRTIRRRPVTTDVDRSRRPRATSPRATTGSSRTSRRPAATATRVGTATSSRSPSAVTRPRRRAPATPRIASATMTASTVRRRPMDGSAVGTCPVRSRAPHAASSWTPTPGGGRVPAASSAVYGRIRRAIAPPSSRPHVGGHLVDGPRGLRRVPCLAVRHGEDAERQREQRKQGGPRVRARAAGDLPGAQGRHQRSPGTGQLCRAGATRPQDRHVVAALRHDEPCGRAPVDERRAVDQQRAVDREPATQPLGVVDGGGTPPPHGQGVRDLIDPGRAQPCRRLRRRAGHVDRVAKPQAEERRNGLGHRGGARRRQAMRTRAGCRRRDQARDERRREQAAVRQRAPGGEAGQPQPLGPADGIRPAVVGRHGRTLLPPTGAGRARRPSVRYVAPWLTAGRRRPSKGPARPAGTASWGDRGTSARCRRGRPGRRSRRCR